MIRNVLTGIVLVAAWFSASAGSIGSTFTYQGHLTESGAAAEGAYDFELALYNVDAGGTAIDVNAFEDVGVIGGLFSLSADFTGAPFEAGGSYWVEARVRDGADTGAHTPLLPRQPVNASPYAIAAQAVIAPLDVAGDSNVQGALTVGGDITTANEVRAGRVDADEIASDGPANFAGGAVIQRFFDSVALLVENNGATQPALLVRTDEPENPAVRVEGQLRVDGELVGNGPARIERIADEVSLRVINDGPNQPALVVSSNSAAHPVAQMQGSVVIQGDLETQANINCTTSGGCLDPDELKPGLYRSKAEIYEGIRISDVPAGEFLGVSAFCADDNDLPLAGECTDSGLDVVGQVALDWVGSDNVSRAGWQCTFFNPGTTDELGRTAIFCIDKPGGD